MSLEASNSIIFTGEFRHGIDPKNRITIPADWRSGEGDRFYVRLDSTGSFIAVLPPDEFRRRLAELETLPSASLRERQQFKRQFSSKTLPCNADKQGRMVLPPDLCTRIGLQGEAMLVGIDRHFEIWNPARWADAEAAEAPTFQNLAGQLGL